MNKSGYVKRALEFRERVYQIYMDYENVLKKVYYFLLVFFILFAETRLLPYEHRVSNVGILLGISLICCFLPVSLQALVSIGVMLFCVCGLSPMLAAGLIILILSIYCVVMHSAKEDILFLVLVPIGIFLKIPAFFAIIAGLYFGPAVLGSLAGGVVIYFFLQQVKMHEGALQKGADSLEILKLVLDGMLRRPDMYLLLLALCVASIGVYLIRKQKFAYMFEGAIAFGGLWCLILFLIGCVVFQWKYGIVASLLGSVISLLLAYVVQFFYMVLDYGAVEEVQFEDEDYFYHVRAVPKLKMTLENREVRKIYASKKQNRS